VAREGGVLQNPEGKLSVIHGDWNKELIMKLRCMTFS